MAIVVFSVVASFSSAGGTQSTCVNGGGLPNVMGHDRSIEGAAFF
jgi:hypothetical protein